MRQIKFRAMLSDKYYAHPRMVPWGELLDSFDALHIFDEECMTLMQYTGLHDKNGNNIYEGDIVRWGDMVGFGHEKPVRVAVVRFDPDICFDSNVGIFEYGNFAYKETDKYLTVIGNIYENPDLLEAEK